tara:strand:- start:64 stop:192 length:129 start_codon:yes stop_codon:yes gene_type:complete
VLVREIGTTTEIILEIDNPDAVIVKIDNGHLFDMQAKKSPGC